MTALPKKKSQDVEDKRRKLALQKKFVKRITIARQGRESFLSKDYVTAVKKYNEYLLILSEMNDAEDIFGLRPAMFDQKRQLTEMLLISHIYWELARTYEMMPKLQPTFNKCLDQFVRFTINQPYQVLNAEMLRKYLKKNKDNSLQSAKLHDAYARIYVQSKKCYIATHCFGENHQVTNDLRLFKQYLLKLNYGRELVRFYYLVSSKLTEFADNNKFFSYLIRGFSVFPLTIIAYLSKKMLNK